MTKGDLNTKCMLIEFYLLNSYFLKCGVFFKTRHFFFPEHHVKVAKVFEFTKALLLSGWCVLLMHKNTGSEYR